MMASAKTEDIALRLWKLKGSTINDLDVDVAMKEQDYNDLSSNCSDEDEDGTIAAHDYRDKNNDFRNYQVQDGGDNSKNTTSSSPTDMEKNKSEEMKPTQSYIALIATAILKSKEKRLVLSDIYKYIMANFSYFQSQDKSWRNSIRHNLSLNECFIKVGRSEQGKGHYWGIHPANYEDFSQGDFRRRRARRRVRRSFLDTHPYTGYPLRPYANIPRPRYMHDFGGLSYRPHLESVRRHIHPLFYENCYYHQQRKFEPLIHSAKRTSGVNVTAQETHDVLKKEKCTVITNLLSPEFDRKPSSIPRKVSLFSIDSILGNKISSEKDNNNKSPQCTDKHCSCLRSSTSGHDHYFPYLYKNISDRKISPDANNVKRFFYQK